ncbi:hypothetical protein ACFVZI_13400, partial [Streptomyces mirabilis]
MAHILQDFVRDLPTDARRHLITSLAQLFDRYGHPERAMQLRIICGELDQSSGPVSHSTPEPSQSAGCGVPPVLSSLDGVTLAHRCRSGVRGSL